MIELNQNLLLILPLIIFVSCGGGSNKTSDLPVILQPSPVFTISADSLSFEVKFNKEISSQLTATTSSPAELVYELKDNPSNGSATVNNNGEFTYKPKLDFSGEDFFLFAACASQFNVCAEGKASFIIKGPEPFLNEFPKSQGVDLVYIYGQSNASGNGTIFDEDSNEINGKSKLYKKCSENNEVLYSENCGYLSNIYEPTDIYNIAAYSPWTVFLINLDILDHRQAVLVNGAVGGTTIRDLLRSGLDPIKKTTNRFQNLIWAGQNVFSEYGRENINSVSIIWLQGESDVFDITKNIKNDEEIKTRFKQYFNDILDLKNALLSDLDIPKIYFYIIRLGNSDGEEGTQLFNPELMNDLGYWQIHFACNKPDFYPISVLPITFTLANGKLSDGLHYSRRAYQNIGEEVATNFLNYLDNINVGNYLCQENEKFPPLQIIDIPYD